MEKIEDLSDLQTIFLGQRRDVILTVGGPLQLTL